MSSSNQKANGSEQNLQLKRRRRFAEEKREIAETSLQAGASVREVAVAYRVHPRQVGKWRRLYRSGALSQVPEPALLSVGVIDGVQQEPRARTSGRCANFLKTAKRRIADNHHFGSIPALRCPRCCGQDVADRPKRFLYTAQAGTRN